MNDLSDFNWGIDNVCLFCLEFFIKEVSYSHPISLIKTPAIAIRFHDFPTQVLYSRKYDELLFYSGKKCKFKMQYVGLRDLLEREPLYIMLVDAQKDDIQILATCALSISCFANNNDFLRLNQFKKPKRNIILLYDRMRNEVAKLDLTLSFYRDSAENFIFPLRHKFSQDLNIANINSNYRSIQNTNLNKPLEMKNSSKLKMQTKIRIDKEDNNPNMMEDKEEGEIDIQGNSEKTSLNQIKQFQNQMNAPKIFSESKPKKAKSFEKSGKTKNLQMSKEHDLNQKPELKLEQIFTNEYYPPPMFFEKK